MEVTSDLRCYRRHLRAVKICGNGARRWWAEHNLSWQDFLDNGIPAKTLADTKDPFALKVVEAARIEADGQ